MENIQRIFYFNYWSCLAKKSIDKIDISLKNQDILRSNLPSRGISVSKGQIIEYLVGYKEKSTPVYKLAVALENSFINDPQVMIVPIEYLKVLDYEKNIQDTKNNIRKFNLGILTLLSKNISIIAKIDEIRILDKRHIKKDENFFKKTYGHAPEYLIDEIKMKYLTFTSLRLINNEKNKKKNLYHA